MDPTTTVRTDALPGLATVVIPGAVATLPYVWWLLGSQGGLASYLSDNAGVAALAGTLVAVGMGFIVESVGSYVEVYLIDRRRPDHPKILDSWWRYLRIAWKTEPIGQRYLRRFLVTFKFELNMCAALAIAFPGTIGLLSSMRATCMTWVGALVGLVIGAALSLRAARGSAAVLAEVRERLLLGVGQPPFDGAGNPRAP